MAGPPQNEIRRRASRRLLAGAARASAAGSEPLTMADLQSEIGAVRKACASASAATFATVWNNPADEAYDVI